MRKNSTQVAAFSLVELLVVVTIIAVGLTIAGPRVQDARLAQRQGELARKIMLLAKHARGEAVAYGRAHLVHFEPDVEGGRFTVFRGVSPNCNGQRWVPIMQQGKCNFADPNPCLLQLAAVDHEMFGATLEVDAVESFDAAADPQDGSVVAGPFQFCYGAMGNMMYRNAAGTANNIGFTGNATDNAGFEGGILFRVERRMNGAVQGVSRRVYLRLGGDVVIIS